MLVDLFEKHVSLPIDEITRLLAMPAEDIYRDASYQSLVTGLDVSLLHRTAKYVRQVYDEKLPDLKARYGLANTVMSGYTLCNWVLGYLNVPTMLSELLGQHERIPVKTMREILPELIHLLQGVPEGRLEWERALLILTLPMLARNTA